MAKAYATKLGCVASRKSSWSKGQSATSKAILLVRSALKSGKGNVMTQAELKRIGKEGLTLAKKEYGADHFGGMRGGKWRVKVKSNWRIDVTFAEEQTEEIILVLVVCACGEVNRVWM